MKKYDVVLADPPWAYTGQQDKWGAAAKFYNTMDISSIEDLHMEKYLSNRGVFFMWTTGPKLDQAFDLIKSMDLYYRGMAFVWIKTKKDGTPMKARGVRPSIVKPLTEFVVAASRVENGRPLTLFDESIVQTVFAPVGEHSAKPEDVQDRIDKMYPHSSKIELFARRTREGWDTVGEELGTFV